MLLAFNWPPSPTVLNQALAISAWGLVVALVSALTPRDSDATCSQAAAALLLALLIVSGCITWVLARGALPSGIALGVLCMVGAAAVTLRFGSLLPTTPDDGATVRGFLWGLAIVGVASALIGYLQVFAPDRLDGEWIARGALPGRASGNLRQPNHLSSLLLWSMIAIVALHETRHLGRHIGLALLLLLSLAVVLTGSRTGVLGMLILAVWGLADRRLSRPSRAVLAALPVLYAALWMALWALAARGAGHAFGGEGRLSVGHGGDISSSRFAIWSDTLQMIRHEPWTGVGFGEFNIAWTLSAFPDRPVAFFDHTHNLPLQLLVELGIPLGSLVIVLLLVALVQAGLRAWACDGDEGTARRVAFMIVLMIGLHSLLEYPLWYAYFLLPTAFAWGYALSPPMRGSSADGSAAAAHASPRPPRSNRLLAFAGLSMTVGAAAAVLDYYRVAVIYDPPANAAPLEARIARGQRSLLFGHHADYAAATAFGEPKAPLSPSQELAFRRAPHQLLDVRLMIAWSQALAAQGELDKARWLAARIREFRNPGADEYFAPCKDAAEAARTFQCQPPLREVHWREFVQR